MQTLANQMRGLFHQVAAEVRLFWRSRQAVLLTFFTPMLGAALFVYLHREGLLDRFFGFLFRSLGAGEAVSAEVSSMVLMTIGIITYCVIAAAFESPTPRLVRQREAGILKRLGGTPLRRWVLLMSTTLNAGLTVLVEVALIFAVVLVSADVTIVGSWWLLAGILVLGIFVMAALGFILANLSGSADGAVVAVHAVYIPMLLLCGAFYPVEAMPRVLQTVAKVLPLTYFVSPFRSVMVEGTGIAANAVDLAILAAWTAVAWMIAVVTFRWE